MEVSALKPAPLAGLRGPSPLLRLQSDERLIALIRRGQHAAFEALFARYQARLLAFCKHMLGSKEDAEDVLQEVFTAAFNAILADEREINVRPWLYRIARNRSLNHLRRVSPIGVDSMDVHYAEGGISTGEKVMRRESFRALIEDVQQLPETQRTALLLREIDALSYEQISEAMDTTIPSVKSLLVRARISLAEASQARELSCEDVRAQLGEAAEGISKLAAPARRHMRSCERCRSFRKHLKSNNVALAAVMPVGPLLLVKKLLYSKLAGAHVAGGAGAGAGAGAAATGGASAASGIATAGAGAIASKAVAGLAAAALVTAGAVEAEHASAPHPPPAPHTVAAAPAQPPAVAPIIVSSRPQRDSVAHRSNVASKNAHHHHGAHAAKLRHHRAHKRLEAAEAAAAAKSVEAESVTTSTTTSESTEAPPAEAAATTKPEGSQPPVTEVMTETTSLPSTAGTTSSTEETSSTTQTSSTTTESSATQSSGTTTSTETSVTGGTPAPSAAAPTPAP